MVQDYNTLYFNTSIHNQSTYNCHSSFRNFIYSNQFRKNYFYVCTMYCRICKIRYHYCIILSAVNFLSEVHDRTHIDYANTDGQTHRVQDASSHDECIHVPKEGCLWQRTKKLWPGQEFMLKNIILTLRSKVKVLNIVS